MNDLEMTSDHVRAARMLLRWEQKILAKRSGVSLPTIKRLESKPGPLGAYASTLAAIRAAFEDEESSSSTQRLPVCAYIAGQSACGRRDGSNDKGYCRPRLKHRTAFGVEGIVSKRVDAPYRSGPHSAWIKVRNPSSIAVQRHRSASQAPPILIRRRNVSIHVPSARQTWHRVHP